MHSRKVLLEISVQPEKRFVVGSAGILVRHGGDPDGAGKPLGGGRGNRHVRTGLNRREDRLVLQRADQNESEEEQQGCAEENEELLSRQRTTSTWAIIPAAWCSRMWQ
jgi:hypothetical protein